MEVLALFSTYTTKHYSTRGHTHAHSHTIFLWKCLHPLLNTCIDKYMLLHYQSTYSTSHVCHPVYSGYRRPHLPQTSIPWQSTTPSNWYKITLTSRYVRTWLHSTQLNTAIVVCMTTYICRHCGNMRVYFAVWGVCVQDYLYIYTCTIQYINCLVFLI